MCNFYFLYCLDEKKRSEYMEYLKKGAERARVRYRLMPKSFSLSMLPDVFKKDSIGFKYPGFYAIVMFIGDAVDFNEIYVFPPDGSFRRQYLYTQDPSAETFVLNRSEYGSPRAKKSRVDYGLSSFRVHYGSMEAENFADMSRRLSYLEREIKAREERYAEVCARWNREHRVEVIRCAQDKQRIMDDIKRVAAMYADRMCKLNGDRSFKAYRSFYKIRKAQLKLEPRYKVPLDNLSCCKPPEDEELNELRMKYKLLSDEFATWPIPKH